MRIGKSIKAVVAGVATYLAMSPSCFAFSVYADFNGDMVYDPTINVLAGSTITASVYASQTAIEVATNAGLNGFGVDLTTGGMPISGNTINSIVLDPQWNFATDKTISDPTVASARVVGNTLIAGGFSDLTVHLFDITLDVPDTVGATYSFNFADIPGDTFVTQNFFVYDPYVVFAETQVSAVPVPAAVWLLLSGIVGLAGISRPRRNIKNGGLMAASA